MLAFSVSINIGLLFYFKYSNSVLNNDEWKENIQKKAIERGLTLDSMMTLDAIWMIQNQ